MKTYFKKVLIVLLIPVIYYIFSVWYIKTGNTTENNISNITASANVTSPIPNQKDFKIIIYNKSYVDDWLPEKTMEYSISNGYYSELCFNMLHNFGDSPGSDRFGTFGLIKEPYQLENFIDYMDAVNAGGFKGLYSTVNIIRLCFAQRMVYEVNQVNGTHDVNNGFCYENCYGEFRTDQGRTVIYASENNDATPRYIAKDIYENLQFGDLTNWAQEDAGTWHIKPMMKIPENTPDNAKIVRIDVINFDNQTIAQVMLKARNFKAGGSYDGQYIEEYIFDNQFDSLSVLGGRATDPGVLNTGQVYDDWLTWKDDSRVSFNVWWYGEADVWFDKMTVDDELANDLYSGIFDPEIKQEASAFTDNPSNYSFYTDEMNYSNIPCIEYVKGVMNGPGGNPNAQLHTAISNYHHIRGLKDNTIGHRELLKLYQTIGVKSVSLDAHEIGSVKMPPQFNAGNMPDFTGNWFSANYDEYNESLQKKVFGDKNAIRPENENDGPNIPSPWGSLAYQVNHARLQRNTYYPGIPMYVQPQMHSVLFYNNSTGKFESGAREPTNEEIQAQAMISIAHGADGIGWYIYQSFTEPSTLSKFSLPHQNPSVSGTFYTHGLLNLADQNFSKRTYNIFGQDKWGDMAFFQNKIKSWKSTLDASIWQSGWSVHSETADHEYIHDILSIVPGASGLNPCVVDFPNGPYMDCPDERYWEIGFYEPQNPTVNPARYFLVFNRRCVPENTSGSTPDNRVLKIDFKNNALPGSLSNWILTEVGNTLSGGVPFLRNVGYVDLGTTVGTLGWFKPGEGKLFKIEPTSIAGGTLFEDEVISGESFTCEAPVYNNGHNITIGANTTIHFNDSSRFVMDGGVFTVGDQNTSAPQNITSDAVPGGSWRGHSFTNCEVKIYGATFTGLANDTTYAVNIIDCPVVDIRNCTFNTNSSLKGGLNVVCFNNPFIAINNIYIGSNTFNSSGSTIPTVNVSSYAGVTTPLIIENNTFNEGNTAVFLSGVIGGAIKGNTITDNYIGINALTSSIDVVQNNISSTVSGSMGIFAAGGSELKLNSSGAFTLGGLNNISNEGIGTNNINVDGSYFLLDDGENIFNISDDQSSYHLYGYFPMFTAVTTEETNNCFKVNSSPVDPPINMVTSGYQGSQITFNFIPYLSGCEIIGGGDGLVINLGDGIYDTIYTGGSGSGGSQSSVASVRRTDTKQSIQTRAFDLPTAKTKYDSVCVLMRYRNYTQAKTKCLDLINSYPDSIQTLFTVSKLFLATVACDTTYNAANGLKIFYENLILNHQSNTSLVKRANYYILKCKVRMREYSQALAGFQQIINLNPYSYEGLIARWDYMATSLLVPQAGSFSSKDFDDNVGQRHAFDYSDIDGNDDDKKPFTKEQRQDIRRSINTAIDVSKNNDETKMKTLEEKSELGDVNASKELSQMKSLKQVVKTEKPKSITEHIKIVSEDIRKVFGTNTSGKGNQPKNLPTVFRISQNYPNPFNPTTKINYDLPKDSKVNIIIYDILGREVKRLVNNELKTAGSYIVDFNAMNYASGVYFYRIEAEEPNGSKFVDSKKMVLLK